MFCFSSPAARRIGRVYSRSNCSDSVSLITAQAAFLLCARRDDRRNDERCRRGEGGQFRTFLRIARRSNIQVFVIGGGSDPGYALTNGGIRLVWGTKRNSRYRCWKRHLETAQRGWCTASGRSDVPPFMVMDVMAAAARIEAAGGHVIHMEVGQPSAPAPKGGDCGGSRRARAGAARLHLGARPSFAARAHRPALPRDLRLRRQMPSES